MVVNNVSLEVERGEIVGLLGPNGAGKTTSFYMIVGMISPNSGSVYIDDDDITNDAMHERAKKGIHGESDENLGGGRITQVESYKTVVRIFPWLLDRRV